MIMETIKISQESLDAFKKEKKKYYARIDNKDLLEDGFEDDLFANFYPATDHRKNNVRHLIGSVVIKEDKTTICDAFVDVNWHFGDSAITITMLACNPFCDNEDCQRDELFNYYEKMLREREKATTENCFSGDSFHVGIERKKNKMEVTFWWETIE